ncbi:MAG: DNA primase [Thaumarchaeota archaeon]|nr:DNA primase [Nitrososphaerota archaeon]
MQEKTLTLLKNIFKNYYFKHNNKVEVPERIEEREFGYMLFGGGMIRHLAIKTAGELKATLVKEAPYGVYTSSSYYDDPSLPMAEKGWKGGDLVFDIDADDLNMPCKIEHDWWQCKTCGNAQIGIRPQKCPSCSNTKILLLNWACDKCLEATKNEIIKLQEILMLDLGISEKETTIYFSGNKGYHMNVTSKSWYDMDQRARNEMADYVSGKGLRPETLGFSYNMSYTDMLSRIPSIGEPSWRGRFAEFIRSYGDEKHSDIRIKAASLFIKTKPEDFQSLITSAVKQHGSRVDPSVTTDIHRIFRLPGSLHGNSGLSKRRCDDILSFNPLVDAVEIGDEEIEVYVKFCSRFSLKGSTFGPYIKQNIKLPLYAATYLMSKDLAEVSP